MTTPNSNSFTNTNPQPTPSPTPPPPPNSPAETSAASFTVTHTIIPPPPASQSAAFLKKHKLVLTAGAATVASGTAGVTAFLEGKKYTQSQRKIFIDIYDKCRTNESFSNEDAIFHLTENGFPDDKIFDLLTSSSRIPPLTEGQKNCMTIVNGKKTASISECETGEAKQVPSQPGASHSSTIVNALIDMTEGIPNVKGNIKNQLIENGQILILDLENCQNHDEEGDNLHYICVEALPSESTDNPKSNYPQSYTVLVILFGGLAGLFAILFFKFINLTKEGKYTDDPESFNNVNYPGRINKEVNNNLINILIKSQQSIISSEETRVLLTKECSFSETVIDEILKNL